MKKLFSQVTVLIAGITAVFLAGGLYAAEVIEVIKMQDKAYKKHKYPVVEFQHKKHAEDYTQKYSKFFKNKCGECHHDGKNKPLTNLKADDKVESCIVCHKEPAQKLPKEKLSKKEKIKKYQAEAIHSNCIDCHRAYNTANKLKSKSQGYAPTVCNKCHVK